VRPNKHFGGISYKPLWELHQIYKFGAVLDRDEHFEVKRSKVKITTSPNIVKNQLFKMHRSGKGRLVDGSLSKTLIQFIFTEIVNEM